MSASHPFRGLQSYPGTLVSLEGIDGSGKTTVCEILQDEGYFDQDVVWTCEPTSRWSGQVARDGTQHDLGIITELGYFILDHQVHLRETILPALERGDTVICDRYIDSRAVYQGPRIEAAYDSVIDGAEFVWQLHGSSPIPDRTIWLDVDPHTVQQRQTDTDEPDVEMRTVDARYAALCEQLDRVRAVVATMEPEIVAASVADELDDIVD